MTERAVLIVSCHPSANSRSAAIARSIAKILSAADIPVVIDDLYRTGFDPVLSENELAAYHAGKVPAALDDLVAHLRAANDLVFIFPLWMFDMPALLKGYFEKVFRPEVAFRFVGGDIVSMLQHVRRLTVVVTHGRSEAETRRSGDSTVPFFSVSLPSLLPGLSTNDRFDIFDLDAAASSVIEPQLEAIWQHFRQSPETLA